MFGTGTGRRGAGGQVREGRRKKREVRKGKERKERDGYGCMEVNAVSVQVE